MSCKCCVSLRGLAYFGASTHVVVGAMFFVEFLESLFSIGHVNQLRIETDSINIGTERLVYHWVFLSLGLLIFQGIDRESKTLLKRSAIIFLLLQALTLAVRLKYGYMYSEPKAEVYRSLGISILATGAYLMILFLYIRKLEASIHGGRLFRPNTTATHIPLSSTNLGWYNHSHSSRSSRGGGNNSGALYSPLNFFGGVVGGFNPLVWTNPGPPPPYTDSAGPTETPLNRSLPTVHSHNTQPCSSRTLMNGSNCNDNSTDTKILTTSRTPSSDRTEPGDPSVVVPLLDENEDKNGLEC